MTQDTEAETELDAAPHKRHVGVEGTIFILLLSLSLGGIFVTDFSPDDGYDYWLFMVFVFGFLAIFVSWLQNRRLDVALGDLIKAQTIHWLHSGIVVFATFLLTKSGHFPGTAADLVILLILGLSTMLDGYRIGWEFSLLGFYLVSCTIIIAYVGPFLWVCSGLALLLAIATVVRAVRAARA